MRTKYNSMATSHMGNTITYLALGDSMSIDKYTGLSGGGAASQFANLTGATVFLDHTFDGGTTPGVLSELEKLSKASPDIVTLTIGGNDLLGYVFQSTITGGSIPIASVDLAADAILANYNVIAAMLTKFKCTVIVNTIYDPTDGDDIEAENMGIPRVFRSAFDKINSGIRDLASRNNFLLADLDVLFRGHTESSVSPWIVLRIEPNLAGATVIAEEWQRLMEAKFDQ